MRKNKILTALLVSCLLLLANCGILSAASSQGGGYSVDAGEIEYDLASGEGKTSGKTTIRHDGGTAVALGGATFNSKNRTGRLFGGVTADRGEQHLRSAELVMYSAEYISAVGDAQLTKGDKTLRAPRVDYHSDTKLAETLGGEARLSSADGSWVMAGKIMYDMNTGVAEATGGVNLENTPQRMTGSGERAVYDSRETGFVELIGNAKITQDGNTVTGERLRITNLSGSDSRTHARGNVRIVYYPKKSVTEEKTA